MGNEAAETASDYVKGGIVVESIRQLSKWQKLKRALKKVGFTKTSNVPKNLTSRGMLSNLRPEEFAPSIKYAHLVLDESGRYWLRRRNGILYSPSGRYDFVTTPSGAIRVARDETPSHESTHLGLSWGGDVRFAGQIVFGSGKNSRHTIREWNNNSGHYRPPADMKDRANLPVDLFIDAYE